MHLIGIILLVIVGAIVTVVWQYRARKAHAKCWSPPFTPFLGALPVVIRNSHRLNQWQVDTARIAVAAGFKTYSLPLPDGRLPHIGVLTAEGAEHILKGNFWNYVKGKNIHDLLTELLGDGIFVSDGDAWQEQRKIASHMFNARNLNNKMEQVFTAHALLFVERLNAQPANEPFDLQDLFFRFTLDCIMSIAFGVEVNTLGLPAHPFGNAFDRAQELAVDRFFAAVPWRLLKWWKTAGERELLACCKEIGGFLDEVIATRRDKTEDQLIEQGDLLSLYLAHGKRTGEKFSDAYLRDVITNFMLAGRDTTACQLTWLFVRLMKQPDILSKLEEEITTHIGSRSPSHDDFKDMEYLNGCVHETLRLHPSVPGDNKEAVKDDTLPDGTPIKAGQPIMYSPYVFGHLATIWGPDVDEFRPERWEELIKESGNRIDPVSQFKFLTFNAGKRLCLGKPMALLETKLLATTLLQKFKFTLQSNFSDEPVRAIILKIKHGVPVTVAKRD